MVGPAGVGVDAAGNIYISDESQTSIFKLSPAGVLTLLAGSKTASNKDGVGSKAEFTSPQQIALDAAGNVYVADDNGNSIRKVTPDGTVTTLIGSLATGPAKQSSVSFPSGVAVDASGNVFVADTMNGVIRMITPAGVVTTLAGKQGLTSVEVDGIGGAARFSQPFGVAVDAAGILYITDSQTVRKGTPFVGPVPGVTAPLITSAQTTNGNVGRPFVYQLSASGTEPTLSVDAASLPIGLKFANNQITGIPRAPAGISVKITATNDSGSDTQTLTLIINSPVNLSTASVKYTDSAIDKPFGSNADGFESITTAKISATATVILTTAEQMSINDNSELYFELGDYVFDHVLATATSKQSGKKYIFVEMVDVELPSGAGKTVKVGTTTISLNKGKLTVAVSRSASDFESIALSATATAYQGSVAQGAKQSIQGSIPCTILIGAVEADITVSFTGTTAHKLAKVGSKDSAENLDLSNTATKGSGSSVGGK